jgi:hypothetical protein
MAEHVIVLPGTEGPEITIRTRAVGFPDVFVAGREIEEISLRGRPAWPIPMADGSVQHLLLRGALTGMVGAVDGVVFPIERRLAPWELLLCLAPFSLVGLGTIAGIVGMVAVFVNMRLVRRGSTRPARLGLLVGGFAVALAVAQGLLVLLSR